MEGSVLPEACVAHIISFTSPADAFNSISVSSMFRSAADSDYVWDKFLPSDHHDIIARSVDNLSFSSKKQLYRRLCEPLLIDNGQKLFKVDKSTGKKSFVLFAKELSITSSGDPTCWRWHSRPDDVGDTRYSEVAELVTSSRFEISGRIGTRRLSPNTKYGAYLIAKHTEGAFGLDLIPCETWIRVGNKQVGRNRVHLSCVDVKKQQLKRLMFGNREDMLVRLMGTNGGVGTLQPKERQDGWLEIPLGEFETGDNNGSAQQDEDVIIDLTEVKGYQLKGGLIVQGIQLTPLL